MFNIKRLALGVILGAMSAFPALAADVEQGVVVHIPTTAEPSINGETLNLNGLKQSADAGTVSPQAAAEGISYFEVYAVGSSDVGWEYPTELQTTTSYDHGGSQLLVAVIQYGYGNPNPATMNGLQKSDYDDEYLCGSMSSLHVCNVGETVTGFLYYYDFSGQESGQFEASASSIAYPYGYWSDSIYIK